MSRIIDKGLIFLLIFTPLAFGTVQIWAISVMEIISFLLLFLTLASEHTERSPLGRGVGVAYGIRFVLRSPLGRGVGVGRTSLPSGRSSLLIASCSLLFLLLVLFQLCPLPAGLLEKLSPASLAVYNKLGSTGDRSFFPLSPSLYATVQELLKLLSCVAVFYVVIKHYRTKEQVHSLVKTILFMAIFLAVFAVLQKALWTGRIFWIYPVDEYLRSGAGIWGPYINRNHFAGYMEMAIPLGLGLLTYMAPSSASLPGAPLSRRVARFLSGDNLLPFGLTFLAVLVMTACIFATLSRGGIAGFVISFAFFGLITKSRRSIRGRSNLLVALAVVVAVIIIFASWEQLEDRFMVIEKQQFSRLQIWKDSLGIIRDFPLLGSGFGAFEHAYRRYQSGMSVSIVDRAHNDYIELLAGTGAAGFILFGAAAALFFTRLYKGWSSKRSLYGKCIGAGGLASCLAIAVHSITDFNLHTQANALLFWVIAGLTYAAIFNVRESLASPSPNPLPSEGEGKGEGAAVVSSQEIVVSGGRAHFSRSTSYVLRLTFYILLFVAVVSFPVRYLIADHYYGQVEDLLDDPGTEELDVRPVLPETLPAFRKAIDSIETARRFAPEKALYPKALSELYGRLGRWSDVMEMLKAPLPPEAIPKQEGLEKELSYLLEAVRLEPANPDYHFALGYYYDMTLNDPGRAEDEFRKALDAFPVSAPLRYNVSRQHLARGRKGDALEQARILAAKDDSYIMPESESKTQMRERRTVDYRSFLSRSYLYGALDIAWTAAHDAGVLRGITPNTRDAQDVLQTFMEWKRIE